MKNSQPQSTSTKSDSISHHPDANMLVEYASGSLPWGLSIAVAAHLQMCPQCRQQHDNLRLLGAVGLNNAPAEAVNSDAFERLLSSIDKGTPPLETEDRHSPIKQSASLTREAMVKKNINQHGLPQQTMLNAKKVGINPEHLPRVVKKLLPPKLRWQRLSSALKSAQLITGQQEHEVAFHKISKGGKVVQHDHRGLEVTLVLEGSFSDEQGIYSPGDFIVKEPGQSHRPTASQNQDCLCLSVCEAPVKVSGLLGKVINPFLRINPA